MIAFTDQELLGVIVTAMTLIAIVLGWLVRVVVSLLERVSRLEAKINGRKE